MTSIVAIKFHLIAFHLQTSRSFTFYSFSTADFPVFSYSWHRSSLPTTGLIGGLDDILDSKTSWNARKRKEFPGKFADIFWHASHRPQHLWSLSRNLVQYLETFTTKRSHFPCFHHFLSSLRKSCSCMEANTSVPRETQIRLCMQIRLQQTTNSGAFLAEFNKRSLTTIYTNFHEWQNCYVNHILRWELCILY